MIKYYFSEHNKNLHLKWDKVINAAKYIIYKRVLEHNSSFTIIGEVDNEKFDDNDVIVNYIFPPEISITNQKDYGIIKVFITDNAKNKITYEYNIIAYDVNNNVISSLKETVELFEKPDRYYYYLQNTKDINAPKEYKISENGCVILNSLENGKYIFYACAEYNNSTSDYTSKRISVDNTIFANDVKCDIPNGVKYNNRYRGPQESKKKDNLIYIVTNNINKLKKKYSDLERHQTKLYEKADYTNNLICNKIDEIKTSSNDIRECIKYDQRNN